MKIRKELICRELLVPLSTACLIGFSGCGLWPFAAAPGPAYPSQEEILNHDITQTETGKVDWQSVALGQTVELPAFAPGSLIAVTLTNIMDPASEAAVRKAGQPPTPNDSREIEFRLEIVNRGTSALLTEQSKCTVVIWTPSGSGGWMKFRGFVDGALGPPVPPGKLAPGETSRGSIVCPVGKTEQVQGFAFAVLGPSGWSGGWWTVTAK